MKNLLLFILILLAGYGCDSTKGKELPRPNYSPYTQIEITQSGDTLRLNTNRYKEYYWYNWDDHLKRVDNGMDIIKSLEQPNERTIDPFVVWKKKCRVKAICKKGMAEQHSNLIYVK